MATDMEIASDAVPRKKPELDIEIIGDVKPDYVKIKLTKTQASVANGLRRAMMINVPTLAIEVVMYADNTSVMDEVNLARRLGLCPIVSKHIREYTYYRDCPCNWMPCIKCNYVPACNCQCQCGCTNCSVLYYLKVTCVDERRMVTTADLQNVTHQGYRFSTEEPFAEEDFYYTHDMERKKFMAMENRLRHMLPLIHEAVPYHQFQSHSLEERVKSDRLAIDLVVLGKHQTLELWAVAKRSIGKDHAKWSPVSVITYTPEPEVIIHHDTLSLLRHNDRETWAKGCPRGVFKYDPVTRMVEVEDALRCNFCGDCVRSARDLEDTYDQERLHRRARYLEKFDLYEQKEIRLDKMVSAKPKNDPKTHAPSTFYLGIESVGQHTPQDIFILALEQVRLQLQNVKPTE